MQKNIIVRDKVIAITSVSFSKNSYLRERLLRHFPLSVFNQEKKLSREELKSFIKDADGVIASLEVLDEDVLRSCPRLKVIAKYGVGLDNIDQDACKKYGVAIGWTGGVNKLSVAEQTLGCMLALCRNLYRSSELCKSGRWFRDGGSQLSGKTVGIIGVGNIGKEVVRLLEPFRCKILVNDVLLQRDYYEANGLVEVSKERIFRESDIVTIHTPLTEETKHLVNRCTLSLMKKEAFLINTSRGGVVHQDDLKQALKCGMIAGAALDVFEEEPPSDMEFLGLENLICTPHIGGNSAEAVQAMGLSAVTHLEKFYGVDSE